MQNFCSLCHTRGIIIQLNGDKEILVSRILDFCDLKYMRIHTNICRNCFELLKMVTRFVDNFVSIGFASTGRFVKNHDSEFAKTVKYVSSITKSHSVNFSRKLSTQTQVASRSAIGKQIGTHMSHRTLETQRRTFDKSHVYPKKQLQSEQGNYYSASYKNGKILRFTKPNPNENRTGVGIIPHLGSTGKRSFHSSDYVMFNKASGWKQNPKDPNRVSDSEEKLHACTICNKLFRHKSHLNVHYLIHTGEKPHKCTVCSKSFNQRSILKSHLYTHTTEQPYSCNLCNKSFKRKRVLNVHLFTHSGERQYTCIACNKSFKQKSSLTDHIRSHTDVKPHVCIVCGKLFCKKRQLTYHQLTHTNEKPYACNVCHKLFKQKSVLSVHCLTHTDEKLHKCTVCNKSFRQISHLRTHLHTHANEQARTCKICNRSFKQKRFFNAHLRIHGLEAT